MYVKLNHFVVHLKLKHCKSTIFQLKKIFYKKCLNKIQSTSMKAT